MNFGFFFKVNLGSSNLSEYEREREHEREKILRDTTPCFLERHKMSELPRNKQKPVTYLLLFGQVPQSASANILGSRDEDEE